MMPTLESFSQTGTKQARRRISVARPAFTLLEMLAVLLLVLLILGLAWPLTKRTISQTRLDAAARALQAELYETRLEAVKNAAPYAFRYRPGTGTYEILPKEILDREAAETRLGAMSLSTDSGEDSVFEMPMSDDASIDAEQAAVPANSEESTTLAALATGTGTHYRKTLPSSVRFGSTAEPTLDGWSPAILFYPNGRTSSSRLSLYSNDRYSFVKTLEFRGLTGTIAPVAR